MTRLSLSLAATLAAVLAASCAPEGDPPIDLPDDPMPVANTTGAGLSLNGTSVTLEAGPAQTDTCTDSASRTGAPSPEGRCHNGPLLSGPLASVALSPVTLADGRTLDAPAALGGTVFSGTVEGAPVQGPAFVGATFTGTLTGGGQLPIRITSAQQGTGAHADVWEYGFTYQDGSGAWQPLCAGAVTGVPLLGRWDSSQGTATGGLKISDSTAFTVGCQDSAVTKCLYLGYKPWAAAISGLSLANHHQACVRALRADYCGNGTSYTTAGRSVNVYDNLGVQYDTEGWINESEWLPSGARCVFVLNRSLLAGILCAPLLATLTCGSPSHFSSGTLLITETPAGPLGGLLSTSTSTQAR